ncbi:hypothetical protein CspeluHIS016_0305210 [Cutaneotrichosporon spelunceum]|uniref:1-phosphatidylinositol 4-kinase n=1 Tax=Cutaneotrichosporon spelunceum TaxID=1672016 RepID=A0AAD3TTK5_9TREE|nr:hypothetical protein CspeluHIS016_0305210 [Cutaneotrichosporon spelunceum]
MDYLDEPLHLEILSALASNLASDGDEDKLSVIADGLPNVAPPVDEDDAWSTFEINHAISYAHYVASLPAASDYLPKALPELRRLLAGFVAQGAPEAGSSSGEAPGTSNAYATLLDALLKAIFWVGWSVQPLAGEAGSTVAVLLDNTAKLMSTSPVFAGVIVTTVHTVLSHVPLPALPPPVTAHLLSAVVTLGQPSAVSSAVKAGAQKYTPAFNTAPHPQTAASTALLVTEIANIVLARALSPVTEVEHGAFTSEPYTMPKEDNLTSPVWKSQTEALLADPVEDDRLSDISVGVDALDAADKFALRWWRELMEPEGSGFAGCYDSDDDVYLTVAVLHLLNLLGLHSHITEGPQVSRLKNILSEQSTITDARVLQAAFVCLAIMVRNFPDLGAGLVHHLRRLLMSPLPALESEFHGSGMELSPTICAASTALATCIEMSPNDDAISSTLYTLLGVLNHGTTIGPNNNSVRYIPNSSDKSFVSGKRSDEQRQLISTTAVEIAARLALDTGREDIIHLAISMLLQRLRGVDIATESAIVTNLVPLALAGSDPDLVEVYRAFSQISRSSHPEDPRMSANAVLAGQTRLARGLGSRLSAADGYLSELLTLFADKGTQIQMLSISSTHGSDKDKYAELRADSAKRASDTKAQLSALLLPIAELLSHSKFRPDNNASTETVSQFRNMWLLCVAFNFSSRNGESVLSEHEENALSVIATKTPALYQEQNTDFVGSDLEYNTILRKDFGHSINNRMRRTLTELLPSSRHASDIRNMSTPQVTLLIAINDLEEMRTMNLQPSVMLQYFTNTSVNKCAMLCPLTGISTRLTNVFLRQLSMRAVQHSMPQSVSEEVCKILVLCTHRMRPVREAALHMAKQVIETFSALMCDRNVVFTLLEILTLMRRSCEMQYTDEYSPVHEFHSDKLDLTLVLTDDYAVRNDTTTQLYSVAQRWLTLAISRAPLEVQSTLQSYLNESRDVLLIDSVEMGAGLALHFSKAISRLDRQETMMPVIGGWKSDCSNLVSSQYAAKNYYDGELGGARHILSEGLQSLQKDAPATTSKPERVAFKSQMADAINKVHTKDALSVVEIRRLLLRAVSVLIASPTMDADILHCLVELPMAEFTPLAIAAGVDAWTWLVRQRPEAEITLMGEISAGWLSTIREHKGLFSGAMNYHDPFETTIEYTPTDRKAMDVEKKRANRLLRPHLLLLQVLSSQFQAIKYSEAGIMISLARLMMRSLGAADQMSTHPLSREVRFTLLLFGFQILASSKTEALLELRFRDLLFKTAFSWFAIRPQWSFGSDRIQVGAEIKLLQDFMDAVAKDSIRGDHVTTSLRDRDAAWLIPGTKSLQDYVAMHRDRVRLMQLLIENEINRLHVWYNPANDKGRNLIAGTTVEQGITADEWSGLVRKAWRQNPVMAVHMAERFKNNTTVVPELTKLIRADPRAVLDVPGALQFFVGDKLESSMRRSLHWLLIWDKVPPVEALNYFQPRYGNDPIILQYAMRVLEQHPIDLTFFFVPQVVQQLRDDPLGYVERFIFETSKISQLFCHQIIWNMKANMYKDDNAEEPDPLKPTLERVVDRIVGSLSGKAREFYNREFGFFGEITAISGKLKPYIKKTKPEKKAKIDEEMAKIKLEVGVYLPSNPDGVVVDLDRKSGRPLQSHAKAPFMATFKVRKERVDLDASIDDPDAPKVTYEVWQSAIFKVGDDCRQDVLALQLIAMFKNVFMQLGLTLYLFPYRVTATDAGRGVIDVVPNATSRDEMGRAQINDLVEYFVDKYGGVDTVAYQRARLNFVQSMAAYSVACYILQIKDRHNGNIMIDGDGHIVHIDFGFLFDIGPGGIKFEADSFKLNKEMVALMGGGDSQGYQMFTELTVKAFLAIRPHAEQLVDTVALMLGTGLPSFKGEGTIKRLRNRFALHLNERGASEFMMGVINNAYQNMRSDIYDGFQKYQNGIPY